MRRQRSTVSGSGTEALAVNGVFPDLIANDTLRRMEELRRLRPIATGGLQSILDQVAFKRLDGFRQRHLCTVPEPSAVCSVGGR